MDDNANQTLLEELEEISDLFGYMVGDGGIAGVLTQLKRLNEVVETAFTSRATKRSLTDQMVHVGDLLERSLAQQAVQAESHEKRWYFVHVERDTGRVLQAMPTVGNSFQYGGECTDGWRLEALEVPWMRDDDVWWTVYVADNTGTLARVGSFNSHGIALAVCQAAWHQAHPEGGNSPPWVRRAAARTVPVRIPPPRAARSVTMVILPPSLAHDAEVFQL